MHCSRHRPSVVGLAALRTATLLVLLGGLPVGRAVETVSPGKYGEIAFASYQVSAANPDGDSESFMMDADGGDQTRTTTNAVTDSSPVWSPNSARISYHAISTGGARIHLETIAADGAARKRLTKGSARNINPEWSAKPSAG